MCIWGGFTPHRYNFTHYFKCKNNYFPLESRRKLHLCTFYVGPLESLMIMSFFTWSDGASELFQFWNMDFLVLVHLSN